LGLKNLNRPDPTINNPLTTPKAPRYLHKNKPIPHMRAQPTSGAIGQSASRGVGWLKNSHAGNLTVVVAGMANSKTESLIHVEVDSLIEQGRVTEHDLRVRPLHHTTPCCQHTLSHLCAKCPLGSFDFWKQIRN